MIKYNINSSMKGRFLPIGLEKYVPSSYSSFPDKEDNNIIMNKKMSPCDINILKSAALEKGLYRKRCVEMYLCYPDQYHSRQNVLAQALHLGFFVEDRV